VQNKFGFTIGGPVPYVKDKLWFFSSGYWVRYRQAGGETLSGPGSLTPDPTGLSQLAAAFPGQPGVAALENDGPYSVKTGNPVAFGTPVIVPVTAGPTTANIEFAEIGRSVPSLSNDEELLERMDWAPTTKDHFFVRYFYQNNPYINGGGSVPAGNWYNVPDIAHSVGGDWSHTLTPSIVNQVRYSFQQTAILFQGGANPDCVWTTPDKCSTNIGISHVSGTPGILGFGYATNIPQGRTVKVTQVQDNVTWSKGKQTILFGGEWAYQNSPNPFLPDYNGGFSFDTFSHFISGTTNSLTLGNSNGFTTKFTEPDAALYFQDDYKITPDLTLNLGLRWEFFGQAVNLLHNETVARESNATTAFWDQSLPLSVRTVAETPDHWKQYQPRLGMAYNPAFDKKLVIRSGFSVNFDPAFYNMFLNSATSAPVVNLGTISGCGPSKPCLPASGASGAEVRAQSLGYLPTGPGVNPGGRNTTSVASNFHNPYTLSWILGLSHQIGHHAVGEVTYVGNHQVGNFQSINANPDLTAAQAAFPSAVSATFCNDPTQVGYGHIDCTHTNVRERTNTAYAEFEALESKLTSQNFHGFTGTVAFTWGKTIDNTSEVFSTEAGGNTITFAENPFDLSKAERALSGDSEKFVASSGFSYLTPKVNFNNGFLTKMVNGYRLDTIWTFNTGAPASFFQYGFFGDGPGLQSYSDAGFDNWQLGGVDTARPVVSNAKAPINTVGVLDDQYGDACGVGPGYYNWATCAPITPDQVHWLRNSQTVANLGNSPWPGVGRNSLRTYSWNNFDASIQKQTKLTERVMMTISANGYNAMNRQYLGTPDTFIDDVGGTLMDYRNSYGSNRNIELKANIQF
jgi:hypothetical protein